MLKRFAPVLATLCLLAPGAPTHAQTAQQEKLYSPQALRQDFDFMRQEIDRIHPDPGLFTSRETLRKAYEKVEAQLQQPLNRDQAWRVFSTLNPVFADGHMFVVQPGFDIQTRAHLAAGGGLFPYEVQVSTEGEMLIRTGLDGAATPLGCI